MSNEREKLCTMCGLPFPATTDYFYIAWSRNGVNYLRGKCKECFKLEYQTYYDKNRGDILDKAKNKRDRCIQDSKDGLQ